MTIDEWRNLVVGKLVRVHYQDDAAELDRGDIYYPHRRGIVSNVAEGDGEEGYPTVEIHYIDARGHEQFYYVSATNDRNHWWLEVAE